GTFQKNHCRLGNDYGKRLLHNTDFCSVIINKERYGHRESETEPGRGSGGKQWRASRKNLQEGEYPEDGGNGRAGHLRGMDGTHHGTFRPPGPDHLGAGEQGCRRSEVPGRGTVVRQPGPVRDAEDKQTVAATLPKQVQAPLPTDWSQDLLQGIGRAGVHQPKYGGSAARRYQGAPHERATRHGSPKEQIRQKTGPQEVFT